MEISSDSQICYGINIGQNNRLPWLNEKWDYQPENWWFYGICKYRPLVERLNNSDTYIDPKFKKDNPIPVDIIRYGASYEYSRYIIAVLGTHQKNCKEDATEIKIRDISKNEKQKVIDFCKKYLNNICDTFPKIQFKWLLTNVPE